MTELEPAGRRCVSFTVSGEWAHFRRVDTTNDKLTYRVIPRTTVAGLVAAILGEPRDSYYDKFTQSASAIAIVPTTPLRTMSVPMLTLPTASGDIQTAEGVSGKTIIPPERLEQERKRRSFEYLRNPEYRIHLILDDETWMERITDRLDAVEADTGRSDHRPAVRPVYTPSLGKTECLANITEARIGIVGSPMTVDAVDSTLPESRVTPRMDVAYPMERSPGFMTNDDHGRHTTGYVSYAYPDDGGQLNVEEVRAHPVNGDTVCFV